MNMYIETDRLIMRDIEESDVQGIFELDSDPEVHQFLGKNPIKTMAEAEGIITYIRDQYAKNGIGRCAIIYKETNEFVGWAGIKLEDIVRKEFDYFDLGYRLKRKFWGKGIASEAATESLLYGFNTLNLEKICGAADVNHVVSNHILKKVGLTQLGSFEFEGEPHNWYELTKKDWLNQNSVH